MKYKHFTYREIYDIMSTGHKPVLIFFCGGDAMKVTIPEITDKELAGLLKAIDEGSVYDPHKIRKD